MISDMVHALAYMMRYSIKTPSGLVPLSEDIQYIEAYVSLMQLRYSNTFEFEFNIDKALMSCYVPKFLLQPIVENAIIHGFSLQEKLYHLIIRSEITNNDIIFEISDDGCGMTPKEIEEIWENKSSSLGIGIKNTNERIKMYYGNNYGITIKSTLGQGTDVVVRIQKDRTI